MLFYGILAQILSAQFCLTVFKHTLTFKIPCLLVVHILYLTLSLYEVGRLTSWPAIDSSTFLHLILFKASFWPNQFAWFFPTCFFHIFCPLFIVQHLLWSPTAFSAYNCHPLSKHAYTDAPPPHLLLSTLIHYILWTQHTHQFLCVLPVRQLDYLHCSHYTFLSSFKNCHFFSQTSCLIFIPHCWCCDWKSLSGKCAKLRTVAASNNKSSHAMITLLLLVCTTYVCIVVLCAHPICGESHIHRNTTGEVATLVFAQLWKNFSIICNLGECYKCLYCDSEWSKCCWKRSGQVTELDQCIGMLIYIY